MKKTSYSVFTAEIIEHRPNIAKTKALKYASPMPEIKAIIFDKDGTLFSYGKIWGPIVSDYLEKGLASIKLDEDTRREYMAKLIRETGFGPDGEVYPDGVIFSDSTIHSFWRIFRLTISYKVNPFYVGKLFHSFGKDKGSIVEKAIRESHFPDANSVIRKAYEKGYIIGIVTDDTEASAKVFLEKMGVTQYISFLRTKDDRTKRKPSPEALAEFCSEFGLESSEVAVVGDSLSDMRFAKKGKAGYIIAVMTGYGSRDRLSEYADSIYGSIADIADDKVLFP